MNRVVPAYYLTFLLIAIGKVPVAHGDENTNPVARDILILSEWFEGEFDNEEQVWFQADPRSATPEPERHERIHTMHRRLDLPSFGDHVFYVEEYKDNDPQDVYRKRLVIFSSGPAKGEIRMQQGFFREPGEVSDTLARTTGLRDLTPEDVVFLDECDVHWQRVAGQFEGSMRPKACVFGEGETRRYSVHDLVLSDDHYWRVDSTFLVSDDSLHVGRPIDRPFRMRRSKHYVCTVIFGNESGASQTIEGLPLHSQGGTIDVTRDSDGAEFTILMRDKEYPYYETRPDFIYFSIRKKGEARSIAYSVNDVRSRTLGISVGGMIAHCYLDGYNFRESYDDLQ